MENKVNPFTGGDQDYFPDYSGAECIYADNPNERPCRGSVADRATTVGIFSMCESHHDSL
jgi:hypothetical protein